MATAVHVVVRVSISLDESLYKRAKREAARRGVPLSEFCRRAIADTPALAEGWQDRTWLRHAGCIEGVHNDSTSVDRVVYGSNR